MMIFFFQYNKEKNSFVLGGSVEVSSIWKITRLAKINKYFCLLYREQK